MSELRLWYPRNHGSLVSCRNCNLYLSARSWIFSLTPSNRIMNYCPNIATKASSGYLQNGLEANHPWVSDCKIIKYSEWLMWSLQKSIKSLLLAWRRPRQDSSGKCGPLYSNNMFIRRFRAPPVIFNKLFTAVVAGSMFTRADLRLEATG